MAIQLSTLRVSAEMDPAKYVAGMTAKVAADRAGTASSVAVGQAISQADQKVSAAGDPLTRLSRQYVEGFRGAEQFNRAVATLGRGMETGNIPLQRADAILDGIYRKFGMTANATELLARGETSLAAAVTAANARLTQQAGQIDTVTAATNRLTVANDNVAASHHNTSNIAAQFQDIGVTAAMGMSPMMIALQQGTQLSAALGNQGLRGTVMSLGGAFASVLSPVSLLTIGVVALGAVGIQALMGMGDSAEDSTKALKEHSDWLNKILKGYDDARKAAQGAADAAEKLPKEAVVSDLGAKQDAALDAFKAKLVDIDQFQKQIGIDIRNLKLGGDQFAGLVIAEQQMVALGLSTNSTDKEFDQFISTLTVLKNGDFADQVKAYASRLLDMAVAARSSRSEVEGLGAAMSVVSGMSVPDWTKSIGGLQGVTAAVDQLTKMTPDNRTKRQQADDIFEQNIGQARTTSEVDALTASYDKFNASLTEQERLQAALKTTRSGERVGVKSDNRWDNATDNFQQRIDSMRLEQETLGQSTYVTERNKAAFDLLNQAKQAGIPITSTVIDQINRQTEEYASVSVEMEKMHARQQQIDQINGTLASGFSNLFQGILNGSQTAAQGIGNLLNSLSSLFINKAFQMVFSGTGIGGGLGGGGGGGGLLGGMIIPGILHDGGMAGSDGYGHGRSFSPSVWNGAVRYHTGGIAGLRPNEVPAILERGETITPRGQGAVRSSDSRTIVQIIDQRTRGGSIKQEETTGGDGTKQLRVIIRDEVQQAKRRGAVGF